MNAEQNSNTRPPSASGSPDGSETTPVNGANLNQGNPPQTPLVTGKANKTDPGLTPLQTLLAAGFLFLWLFLFAGGISVDTTTFRCAVSGKGAEALAAEAQPGDQKSKEETCKNVHLWSPVGSASFVGKHAPGGYRLAFAWLGILLFFLPLNLAMVSAAAGALGAIGNKANLEHDPTDSEAQASAAQAQARSHDDSSPIMSGLLRGLFVYLFFISGLLLFDDKPFSSPGPGQYIRLAGFISLISFLVNYRPHLFAAISDWAYERINSRKVVPAGNDVELQRKTTDEIKLKMPVSELAANGQQEKVLPRALEHAKD